MHSSGKRISGKQAPGAIRRATSSQCWAAECGLLSAAEGQPPLTSERSARRISGIRTWLVLHALMPGESRSVRDPELLIDVREVNPDRPVRDPDRARDRFVGQ